jgi:hypothetical protein
MPPGVLFFLVCGFLLMGLLGLTLPLVVGEAVDAPVSGIGILWMLLLAYLIFTLTLVLQRKEAARLLALGLASLTLPLILLMAAWAGAIGALFAVVLALLLFRGLTRPASRAWFNEP